MYCGQFGYSCINCLVQLCTFVVFRNTSSTLCVKDTIDLTGQIDFLLEPGNEVLCEKVISSTTPSPSITPSSSSLPYIRAGKNRILNTNNKECDDMHA